MPSTLFDQAVIESKQLSQKPSNDTLLKLYALYKQSIDGDVIGEAPSNPFDFVAKAKYEAWKLLRGKSTETAQEEYILLVNTLKN